MHGIPRSTLHDHVSGRVELHRKPYLTPQEEVDLPQFLVKCVYGLPTYTSTNFKS